jgi:hypothetical protein
MVSMDNYSDLVQVKAKVVLGQAAYEQSKAETERLYQEWKAAEKLCEETLEGFLTSLQADAKLLNFA